MTIEAINFLEHLISKLPEKINKESEQRHKHAVAWIVSEALFAKSVLQWGLEDNRSPRQQFIAKMAAGQSVERILKGVPMNTSETAWLEDLDFDLALSDMTVLTDLYQVWKNPENRLKLVKEDPALDRFDGVDNDLDQVRDMFAKWCDNTAKDKVEHWHTTDTLIPEEVIAKLGELGAFGLTFPEEYGGTEMGSKVSSVVSDELSRCWIALGSLATRVDIVGEAIHQFGTKEQKQKWLPDLIAGTKFAAAVFTEPGVGSDLAALKTRAEQTDTGWSITGQKTWITHGARSDLMLVLARTDKTAHRHKGLSLLLVPKTRERGDVPFPDDNISGGEIEVLGYRGMKEHEIAFDGYQHPGIEVLGGVTEKGFGQLMSVFEGARVQTAARAVGVAQSALEEGWIYAQGRTVFGKSIADYDRTVDKLASAMCDVAALRALTFWVADEKETGRRCDFEAGVAKMLGARVAISVSDSMLQIHGGNGYALEYPISRIWSDARVLAIFEGASEIQADVIARRLTENTE